MDGPLSWDHPELADPDERVVTVCESCKSSEAIKLLEYILTRLFLANHNKSLKRKRKQAEDWGVLLRASMNF